MAFLNAPQFTSRQPVQFISDDEPSLSITTASPLQNNPNIYVVSAGNVAKSIQVINGTNKITGQGEFPPFALDIEWSIMSYSDYQRLAALQPFWLTFISHRNLGFYGRMLLGGPGTNKPYTADVVQAKAQFLVLNPSDDGSAATVKRIPAPATFSATTQPAAGFIPNSTTTHYWLTFHSIYGETTPTETSITTTGAASANTLTWDWPSDTDYCTYASLYCGSSYNVDNCQLMAEILSGQSPTWIDLVGFNGINQPGAALYQQPPTANTAYRGQWNAGIWQNEAS